MRVNMFIFNNIKLFLFILFPPFSYLKIQLQSNFNTNLAVKFDNFRKKARNSQNQPIIHLVVSG